MFAAVRALVYAKGYREAGLKCLILACETLHVRPGDLEPRHLVALERVQGFKLKPGEGVDAAAALVARAEVLLAADRVGAAPASGSA